MRPLRQAGQVALAARAVLSILAVVAVAGGHSPDQGGAAVAAFSVIFVVLGVLMAACAVLLTRRFVLGAAQALAFVDLVIALVLVASGADPATLWILVAVDLLVLLILGVRVFDRVRGSGWMDCPQCGEHAMQDVVDRLTFVRIGGYRLGIVTRRRDLLCRRCGFRRRAARRDVAALQTAGERVRPTWLPPMGLIGIIIIGLAGYTLFGGKQLAVGNEKITFTTTNAAQQMDAPLTIDEPTAWNEDVRTDSTSNLKFLYIHEQFSGGFIGITIRRDPGVTDLGKLIELHFSDPKSTQTAGFPDTIPKASCTTVAGEKAAKVTYEFTKLGSEAKADLIVFVHQKVGYAILFEADQAEAQATLPDIEDTMLKSIKFTGSETLPSPSPGATPTPSAAPTPAPTPAPPGAATPSPSPTPFVTTC